MSMSTIRMHSNGVSPLGGVVAESAPAARRRVNGPTRSDFDPAEGPDPRRARI